MPMKPEAETQFEIERTAALLGGRPVLGRKVKTQIDVHDILIEGLPGRALTTLVARLTYIRGNGLEKATGMSLRTVQRTKVSPGKTLDSDQSARTWKFAETLAQATVVFGTQQAAEDWFERSALGLGRRRPIDLMATPAGAEIVQHFLTRLEHGVYT